MAAISKHLFPNDNDPTTRRRMRTSNSQRLQGFCQRLAMNDPTLTELYLGGRCLGDNGVKALAAVLPGNTKLKVLNLSFNGIGNAGVIFLADKLPANTSVEILRLEGNRIGDEGAMALRETLRANRSLKTLSLYKNGIGPIGAAALANGLQDNGYLQVLDLYGNNIGNEGARSIGLSLKSPQQKLKELNLGANRIGFEGAIALVEGLPYNTSLKVLDLRVNEIGNAGAKAFGSLLVVNQGLNCLYLHSNGIGTEGAAAIVEDGLQYNYFVERLVLGQIGDASVNTDLDFYLRLNRAGRRLLRTEIVPCTLWAHVLARVRREPDNIYYFLQAIPHLFKP